MIMLVRIAAGAMCVLSLHNPAPAKERASRAARAWIMSVLERVEGTAALVATTSGGRRARTVDVHLRVAANGEVLGVEFGNPTLSETNERRLRSAVIAAAPFGPPPSELLAPDGATELDFPLVISERLR